MCELERDLEIRPAGDLTEIGEKGINLSGGQKARISVARAVYQQKDIYLMDDPISALDASVRKKLFQNVIVNHLKDKTVVLVTHAIDFIHLADKIYLMDDGKIITQGSYDEIKDNHKLQNLLNINKINNGTPNRETESSQRIQEEDPLETMGERDNKINYSEALRMSTMGSMIQKSDEIPDGEKLKIFEKLGRVTEKDDGKIIKR